MPDNDDLPADSTAVTKATEAARQLKTAARMTFPLLLDLARGWQEGQAAIMRMAHTNQTKGTAYNHAFTVWMSHHPDIRDMLKAGPSDNRASGEVMRSNLVAMLREEKALLGWWNEKLSDTERAAMGSPITIMKKFKDSQKPAKPALVERKSDTFTTPADDEKAVLRARVKSLEEEVELLRDTKALGVTGLSADQVFQLYLNSVVADTAVLKIAGKLNLVPVEREKRRAAQRRAEAEAKKAKGGKP